MRRNIQKSTISIIAALLISCSFTLPSFAQNLLSGIQINPDGNSYQVVLKTNKATPIKKVIESAEKIYLEIQNVELLSSVNTVYNEVPNVKNVIVEPTSKNSVRIFLQGKNMKEAKVQFESEEPVLVKNKTQQNSDSIELNPPIRAYNPIYENEQTEESEGTSFWAILGAALKQVKSLLGSSMMTLLGIILVCAFGFRLFQKGNNSLSNLSIGLPKNLKNITEPNPTAERNRERVYLDKLKEQSNNSTMTNYGIKSYQESQRSPYATPFRTPVHRNKFTTPTIPASPKEIKATPVADLASKVMTATLNSHATENNISSKNKGVDSAKFLESMTKIYEENGRMDLAEGLKKSLKRTKN